MVEPMRKGETVRRALLIEAGVAAVAVATGRRRPAIGLLAAAGGALAAWGAFARNSPLYGSVLYKGSPAEPRFALTFDDGPGPSTPAVLDALREAKARATFFVLGRQVERHPDLVRRIVAEGHELANHGYDHGILVFRNPAHVQEQLERTERAISAAAGRDALTRTFRAPHGFRGPVTAIAARLRRVPGRRASASSSQPRASPSQATHQTGPRRGGRSAGASGVSCWGSVVARNG
jgi:peptidoglycan/xylan/chitin deacetylase (PgdA/CDA1 family)